MDERRWLRRSSTRWWMLAAVAAGIALRLGFILHIARITGDSLVYGDFARNLIQHGVYGFTVTGGPPRPSLIRVPGYPLLLAACFLLFGVDHYQPLLYLQLILDLITCGLLSALSGRLFGRRSAVAALWLAAMCPFIASYVAAPLTETATLFTIALAFYALERWRATGITLNRWAFTLAAALAWSILLRPEQGLLAASVFASVIASFLLLPEKTATVSSPPIATLARRLTPVAITALCVLIPLIPWSIRNWRTFHVFQPLAPRYATDPGELVPLGFQRWYRTWGIDFASTEAVYWNYDTDIIAIADLPTRAFDNEQQYLDTATLLHDYNQNTQATVALDQRFNAIAEERILADPLRYYVALPMARLVNMLLRPRMEMFEVPLEWWKSPQFHTGPGHRWTRLFAAAYGVLNLAYFALAAWGLILWRRIGWASHGPLVGAMAGYAILRCLLLLTIDNSEPRYTLELFPILIVWASAVFGRRIATPPESLRPSR